MWQLQRLEVEVKETRNAKKLEETAMEEEEDFMQELEGDRGMRDNVNLYKVDEDNFKRSDQDEEENENDDQKITLDELLEGLDLEQGADEEDRALAWVRWAQPWNSLDMEQRAALAVLLAYRELLEALD